MDTRNKLYHKKPCQIWELPIEDQYKMRMNAIAWDNLLLKGEGRVQS